MNTMVETQALVRQRYTPLATIWRWLVVYDQPPRLHQLLRGLLTVVLFGLLTGPLIALAKGWLWGKDLYWLRQDPLRWMLVACGSGAVFAVSYYLLIGIPMLYLRPLIRDYPPVIARTLLMLTAAIGGSLGFALPALLLNQFTRVPFIHPSRLARTIIVDGLLAALLGLVITAFTRLRTEVREAERVIHEKELHERRLAEAVAQAQAQALQSQINPHFFFNTLNTISALIPEDPVAARELVGELAELFRYTLRCARLPSVTLGEELAFVRTYLRIEQARLGPRLRIEWQADESLHHCTLPGLTLQPIVENAIRHGIAPRLDGGVLTIAIQCVAQQCRITIRNPYEPGDGPPDLRAANLFQPGHALAIVRERLTLMFADRATLQTTLTDADEVEVMLTIPMEETLA